MMKPAKRNSLRGRVALGVRALGLTVARTAQGAAMAIGGYGGRSGYEGARRSSRRTGNWGAGEGSARLDILTDLPMLRGRSRDLDRNHALAHGAVNTRVHGVVGAGLQMRSVIDGEVLGITDPVRLQGLQYQLEREWELFEAECDWGDQLHLRDLERLWMRSADVSGDVGIVRRFERRAGQTYGTKLVTIEADRISNPNRSLLDTDSVQGGVVLNANGVVQGYHVSDRHPGDLVAALKWTYVPRRGPSGMLQMILAADIERPGQVRGVPLFAPIMEALKQMGDYSAAELKAAINDAYMFAFEKLPTEVDDEGQPIITRPDGEADAGGELTLEDLMVTTLAPGSEVQVKKPERPNTAFDGFISSFAKQIGAALDLPYEVLMKHFGASFSASRGALEIAFKSQMVKRAWFIRAVMNPIREWQMTELVASGRFEAPGFFDDPIARQAWLGCEWIGPTRVQINPQVEANADKIDMAGGVKSREQVMTERTGGSFDTKARQILREREVLGETPAGEAVPAETAANDQNQGNGQ